MQFTKLENWRLQYISGTRKKWVYLSNEEIEQWPLSDVEKFNLGIPIDDHIKNLKLPTTSLEAAANGFRLLKRAQAEDGDWPACCTYVLFNMPMYVFSFYILGFEIPEPQRIEHIRYVLSCANAADGGWGMTFGDESTAFGTALNYTCLRMLGLEAEHPKMKKARSTLKRLGGAIGSSIMGKFWLSLLNLHDWSGLNSLAPEIWLLPDWFPVHPSKWYIFTRVFHAPMSYLYRVRFKAPVTELTKALRKELYVEDYDTIDWPSYRNISVGDAHVETSGLMKVVYFCLNGLLESYPIETLNKKALDVVYQQVCFDMENTNYHGVVSSSNTLALIVQAHAEGVNSAAVQKLKEASDGYLWMTHEGMHVTVSTGLTAWAGSLIGHALLDSGLSEWDENQDSIIRLIKFLGEEQMTENAKHYPHDYRQMTKGGWVFGMMRENGYLLVDCTGETLAVILQLSSKLKPNDRLPEWRLHMSVDLLLGIQSDDGGFPGYEAKRGSSYLELINPSQEFDDVMVDYSTPEVTVSATTALADFRERYAYRRKDIDLCIRRAVAFLHASQLHNGGWASSWGICFTYGVFFALRGLSKLAHEDYSNSESVRRPCHFLLSHQREDGGWGESRKGVKLKKYVQAEKATVVQTAWATLALIFAKYPDKYPIQRAVRKVMGDQLPDGSWPHEAPCGYAFKTCAMQYPLYRIIFPVWMLGVAHGYLNEG